MTSNEILIDTVRISGFRGIECLEVSLPRVGVMIGTNNAGKTSVLKAIQLAIGDYSRSITEEGFYIDNDGKRADEVVVDIRIVPKADQGKNATAFTDEWASNFGDKIRALPDGSQFLALRARALPDEVKGGYTAIKGYLDNWVEFHMWHPEERSEKTDAPRIGGVFHLYQLRRNVIYIKN